METITLLTVMMYLFSADPEAVRKGKECLNSDKIRTISENSEISVHHNKKSKEKILNYLIQRLEKLNYRKVNKTTVARINPKAKAIEIIFIYPSKYDYRMDKKYCTLKELESSPKSILNILD